MKNKNLKKHVNIHIITLVITVMVVALLDSTNMYKISPVIMTVFLVGYSLYIIISTIWMLTKEETNKKPKK